MTVLIYWYELVMQSQPKSTNKYDALHQNALKKSRVNQGHTKSVIACNVQNDV